MSAIEPIRIKWLGWLSVTYFDTSFGGWTSTGIYYLDQERRIIDVQFQGGPNYCERILYHLALGASIDLWIEY